MRTIHRPNGKASIAIMLLTTALVTASNLFAQSNTSGVRDDTVHARIVERISRAPELRGSHITVSVTDRVVTLSGNVDSKYLKRYAERLARVKDVRRIENRLTVEGRDHNRAPNTRGAITPPPIK